MRVLVAGGSGLIGTALVRYLRDRGDEVARLVRRPATRPDEFTWSPSSGVLDSAALNGTHALVNLSGAGVGDQRWSPEYKKLILDSRVSATSTLANALVVNRANAAQSVEVFVSASAIGYYGETGEKAVTEASPAGNGFLADVCVDWESAAKPAAEVGVRVVHPRTGLVMSKDGGALARMLPIFKAGLGGRLGSGRQWWSFISLQDEIRAICALIDDQNYRGPVNLTAPEPARNIEVTKALGRLLRRPAFAAVPASALRIALGEFSIEVLGSAKVMPSVLAQNGFAFADPTIEKALRSAIA